MENVTLNVDSLCRNLATRNLKRKLGDSKVFTNYDVRKRFVCVDLKPQTCQNLNELLMENSNICRIVSTKYF